MVSNNLIFLWRAQQHGKLKNVYHQLTISKTDFGVLSLQSSNGELEWLVKLKQMPVDINCEMLDVDGLGKPDCLISGKNGLLISLKPVSGSIQWNSNITVYEKLPLLVADLNNDNINDLISVEITNDKQNIVFMSGKTGKLIIRHTVQDCNKINLISIESNFSLLYSCGDDGNICK